MLGFRVVTRESVFDEDDLGKAEIQSAPPEYADSFLDAVGLLDRYPWATLHPVAVHPDYLNQVLQEVQKRGGTTAELRWREELAGK
jgi:hypothetical protein